MEQAVGRARELGATWMGVLAGRKAMEEPGQEYVLKCIGLERERLQKIWV